MADQENPPVEDTEMDENDMAAAMEEIAAEESASPASGEDAGSETDVDMPESGNEEQRSATDLSAVYDVPVQVSAVLGRANMQVSQLLKLGRGAVVELDRKVGEAIDIYVNNRLVARGEVVVVDERLGVTMTEIVKSD
ncbi:MAG: flagellar motor switch protein FliN [Alphaproteobacteria bacterium]|nr:flagellar motor switch protein FliN [Alphaproteobacteria bacterium]